MAVAPLFMPIPTYMVGTDQTRCQDAGVELKADPVFGDQVRYLSRQFWGELRPVLLHQTLEGRSAVVGRRRW